MGLSLKTAATRFSRDLFEPWDPATNTFLSASSTLMRGKLFRADRFVTIYHRPTRRAYLRFVENAGIPASGVVRRQGTDEIYLVSETARTEVYQNSLVYDRLRMSHLVTPPSGGLGEYHEARVTGTGDDLGRVSFDTPDPVYVDLEMQAQVNVEEAIDTVSPRFLLNFSTNVRPEPGDYFKFDGDWYLVYVPYVDGGLRLSRVNRTVPGYKDMVYKRHTGTGSYSPVTGTATPGVVDRAFSGVIGRSESAGEAVTTVGRKMEVYIYHRHLGFTPAVGDKIVHGGASFTIQSVVDTREEQQWKLEVAR